MSNPLSIIKTFSGLLSKPGDRVSAEITKSGLQVVKLIKSGTKHSVVRYPDTGTIVETIVHRLSK